MPALLLPALLLALAAPAEGHRAMRCADGTSYHWELDPLPGGPELHLLLDPTWQAAARRALGWWNEAGGTVRLFGTAAEPRGTACVAESAAGFALEWFSTVGLLPVSDSCAPQDPTHGLATTIVSLAEPGCRLQEVDLVVFSGRTLVTDQGAADPDPWDSQGYDSYDAATVVAHELGHAAGLAHEDCAIALMNGGYHYTGEATALHPDDLAGLAAIYPGAAAAADLGLGGLFRPDACNPGLPPQPVAIVHSLDEDAGGPGPVWRTRYRAGLDELRFDVVLQGFGGEPLPAVDIAFLLSADELPGADDILLDVNRGATVEAGHSFHFEKVALVPAATAPGRYQVIQLLDPQGALAGFDRANDVRVVRHTVRALPDDPLERGTPEQGGEVQVVSGCTPLACAADGRECGRWPDGCGGERDCGSCPPPRRCADGRCLAPGACGDGSCDALAGETCRGCPTDCGECPQPSRCGDDRCDEEAGESCQSCPPDCGHCTVCGDGSCDEPEDCWYCPQDCGSCLSRGEDDTGQGGDEGGCRLAGSTAPVLPATPFMVVLLLAARRPPRRSLRSSSR